MASKKDLVEAQTFSRRRLLTAFVSGAPGGRELEPTKPLRAVVTGIGLAVLLVLGSLGLGMLKPAPPTNWDDNTVIITDGGSRYVALGGTLYPVLNTTSARLLVTGGLKAPVRLTDAQIAKTPRGPTLGIPGAPDALPATDGLVSDGWLACVSPSGGLTTVLPGADLAAAVGAEVAARDAEGAPSVGLLVESASDLYLVVDARWHLVPRDARDSVLRALDQPTATPWQVPAAWLNLFAPGSDLEPIALPGAGDPVPDPESAPPGVVVGSVLRVTDGGTEGVADRYYVIDAAGDLAPISDLALRLYNLGSGDRPPDIEVSSAQVNGMRNAQQPVEPEDWPTALPEFLTAEVAGCARLATAELADASPTPVHLVGTEQVSALEEGTEVLVGPAGGALVVPVAGDVTSVGYTQLIDATGTAYAMPGVSDEILARLGYLPDDVTTVPQPWLALFGTGPAITVEAAQQPHLPGEASADAVPDQQCEPGTTSFVQEPPPALARLGADAAWQLATGAGVTVAVVDSGVDVRNVHLTDAVLAGVDLVSPERAGNGWTDPAGHGTAIAGLIAARHYEAPGVVSGVIGLAPYATILPVRVYVADDDAAREAGTAPRTDRMAAGIRYAAEHGAQIINVSVSSTTNDPDLEQAVHEATALGSLVVASAGNRLTSEDTTDSPRYPAAYPEALAVTAVDDVDRPTEDSIHGPHLGIAAPGTNVLTTFLDGGDCMLSGANASSSFATGYVSAAAALIAERYPDETPAQWAYRLMVTAARPQAGTRTDLLGWGVVRPWAALAFVDDGTAAGPPSPVHPAGVVAEPTLPVIELSDRSDALVTARTSSLWWVLGGAAALVGATLLSFPGLRRRRPGARRRALRSSALSTVD